MGHIECMGEMTNAHKILFGTPQGKISLGRHRCKWEDNIVCLFVVYLTMPFQYLRLYSINVGGKPAASAQFSTES
jgi:hypothetical protein